MASFPRPKGAISARPRRANRRGTGGIGGCLDTMNALSERLQTPISTAELERRWAAVRAAMEREKIDVLLMQNNNDYMGGYVKYFTDLPGTNGYPLTVVLPRDDLMTVVGMGPFGGDATQSCPHPPPTRASPLGGPLRADALIQVVAGARSGADANPPANPDGIYRGVKQVLTTPSFASCHYTAAYDAELAARALAPY